jgi:dGTP triphosphohydrolase
MIGGLKPNVNEIVQLLDTSNTIFDEIQISLKDNNSETQKTIKELINTLPDGMKKNIVTIAKRAQYKAKSTEEGIELLRREIENSFDSSMQRAGGVYKRNAKGVAILIGILLAFGANADTFHIIDRLSKDSVLREAIVYKTAQTLDKVSDPSNLKHIDTKEILQEISLPIGWTKENLDEQIGWHPTKINGVPIISLLTMLFGWLVSALAIAMGAPFWFDLLSKVMNVRNSGKSAKSSKNRDTDR